MSVSGSISKNHDMIPLADLHFVDFNYQVGRISYHGGMWKKQ